MGGRFHPKLNIGEKPIAKKYCEGKVKRTLKRELKVLEIVEREANVICNYDNSFQNVLKNYYHL